MTTEAIANREREIEVTGSELSKTLEAIRAAGGWVPLMDVSGCKYTLKVIWSDKPQKQGELL